MGGANYLFIFWIFFGFKGLEVQTEKIWMQSAVQCHAIRDEIRREKNYQWDKRTGLLLKKWADCYPTAERK